MHYIYLLLYTYVLKVTKTNTCTVEKVMSKQLDTGMQMNDYRNARKAKTTGGQN